MEENIYYLSSLFSMLHAIKPISIELETALAEEFRYKKLDKGELVLKEGEICRNLWFLAGGMMRSFHTIGDKEFTSRIMFPGHIVISAGSFFTQTNATETIETLSETEVLVLSHARLNAIYERYPEFNYHTRIITEQYFYKQEQRLYMLRKPDAITRYEYFLDHYADYLQLVPQKYLASFLGITRETLSRMRSKVRK